jgi:hypothetical protein
VVLRPGAYFDAPENNEVALQGGVRFGRYLLTTSPPRRLDRSLPQCCSHGDFTTVAHRRYRLTARATHRTCRWGRRGRTGGGARGCGPFKRQGRGATRGSGLPENVVRLPRQTPSYQSDAVGRRIQGRPRRSPSMALRSTSRAGRLTESWKPCVGGDGAHSAVGCGATAEVVDDGKGDGFHQWSTPAASPAYESAREPIHLSWCVEWQRAMAAAQLFERGRA